MPLVDRLSAPALALVFTGAFAALGGCSPIRDNPARAGLRDDPCEADLACGSALVCAHDGTCQEVGDPGTAESGEACGEDADCRFGLLCSGDGQCGDVGLSPEGEGCQSPGACEAGLVCSAEGRCASPGSAGTTAEGGDCADDGDCALGLICGAEAACIAAPRWSGVDCEGSALPGPPRVLFDVPRGDFPEEFYRLPFPNDVRLRPASVDLTGFPGADVQPEPGELLGRYLAALRGEPAVFSPHSAAIFRFSVPVEFDTLDFGGEQPNFLFVDITPDSDSRGRAPRSRFYATAGRARYICPNWLGIRPSEGTPLTYGHTYAVVFRRGLTDQNGRPLEASDDLAAVLGDVPPEHPALRAGWTRYALLRAWLTEAEIPAEDVIGASVFTVGDPRPRLARVREAVHTAPRPQVEAAVVCRDGVDSPCAGRQCPGAGGGVVEVHARLSLPGFLQGLPPYREWGGDAVYQDGLPRVQRAEAACAVLTVPAGAAPAEGWPVAIFAHDLGGEARTAVETGLAARLAAAGWATLGYDGVLHGQRYGDGLPDLDAVTAALDDPFRPGLMRDQAVQGTADLYALVRLLTGGVTLPDGAGALSQSRLAFIGHGRGGAFGVPFAAYEPNIEAVVLAGVGGDLVDWLQRRTAPRNIAAELLLALAEREFNGMHPALHLMQSWLDPRDPVHYGVLLRRLPEGVETGKHLFFLYGLDDPITPPATMNHLAIALRIPQIGPVLEELTAVQPVMDGEGTPLPEARGNVRVAGERTHALKQYAPTADSDGHRVLFDHPEAQRDVERFFRDLLTDPEGLPTIAAGQ